MSPQTCAAACFTPACEGNRLTEGLTGKWGCPRLPVDNASSFLGLWFSDALFLRLVFGQGRVSP